MHGPMNVKCVNCAGYHGPAQAYSAWWPTNYSRSSDNYV